MKVTQIIAEEKVAEAPVSGIRQGMRKLGAKTLAKVGARDAAAGMAAKVDSGNQANKLYTAWRSHVGSMEGNKNKVDPNELRAWMKQNKLPATKVPQTGVLKDKQVQQLIKQAVLSSKSLAGQQQTDEPKTTPPTQNKTQQTPPNQNTQSGDTPPNQNTKQQTPPVDKNKDGKDDNTGQPVKPQTQNTQGNNQSTKTVPPEIQKQLDSLTPEQQQQLVKML